MPAKPNTRTTAAGLRRRAEGRLHNRRPAGSGPKSASDTLRVLHELEVHKIELEMQNSELRIARDALEVALEKYTDLYDFAPSGYFSVDESGAILEANLTSAALLGVERSRLIGQRLRRFVVPASQPVLLAFLQALFAGKGKQVCEAAVARPDAAALWASFHGTSAVHENGSRKRCRITVSDITSLRKAEEILRRNEVLFSSLIEQAPVGVYVVDGQLRLQQVNPKARPVFSSIHRLEGRDISEIIHILWPEKIANDIVARFRQTLKTGEPYFSPDFSAQRRDTGVTEDYEWQLQRITLPAGERGVACFFSNITERKRAEAARQRMEVLAASNQKLEREIVRRQLVEESLKRSEQNQIRLLEQSHDMQEQLRRLSRQILSAQEEERKKISRELHDVIAQTLTSINVRLASLKKEALHSPRDLDHKIARTQRLVEHSVDIVHRFARELRPTVLDDLGLIPALHAFMKSFREETGIRVSLSAFAAVEQVNGEKRTVLFRVAQEALTNIARHARASQVRVKLAQRDGAVCLKVIDNGKGFQEACVLHAKENERLGLLGMRERLDMVGGKFSVTSAPGKGTTVRAEIPLAEVRAARAGGGGRTPG